jgi:hypothetical protein
MPKVVDGAGAAVSRLPIIAALAIWFIGFETRGRTIEEIDSDLTAPTRVKARVA